MLTGHAIRKVLHSGLNFMIPGERRASNFEVTTGGIFFLSIYFIAGGNIVLMIATGYQCSTYVRNAAESRRLDEANAV